MRSRAAIRDWTYTWHPATIAGLGDGESLCAWMTCRKAATSKIVAAMAAALAVAAAGRPADRDRRARHRRHGGARPDRLGARHRSMDADPRRQRRHRRSRWLRANPARAAGYRAPYRHAGGRHRKVRRSRSRQHRGGVEGHLRQGRPNLSRAQACHVLGPDALGLRRGAKRDGAVLLPERPRGLSRHLVLQRSGDGASAAAPARPASSPRPM